MRSRPSRTIFLLALLLALALPGCVPQTAEQPSPIVAPSVEVTATMPAPGPFPPTGTPMPSMPTPAETPAPLGPIDRATLVISYHKQGWGDAPYGPSVTVWGDGRAIYSVGSKRSEIQLGDALLNLLVEAVERADVFSREDYYNGEGCGMHQPSISISISANGRTKDIHHYLGACDVPQQLKTLESDLELLLHVEEHSEDLSPRYIKWFIGLGTGTAQEQVDKEQAVAEQFSATNQHDIVLSPNVIPNAEAYNILATQIAASTPPDIIGPVGIRGITSFQKDLLPLDDLIARHGVDLSLYEPAVLDAYRNEQGQLIALPYALFPSFIYFNKDLFDAAGLAYPPQQFGALYEGKPWNMDALRALGMRLTLDARGRNATEPGFDPTQIVQFGFNPQWNDSAISEGAFFGTGDLTAKNNEATIPEAWKEAWRWFYRARHVDRFVPDAAALQQPGIESQNIWKAGKVAMAWTHLWFTCCFEAADVPRWDLAVVPSYNGTTTANLHADTFAIMHKHNRSERELDAIFTAYLFLLRSPELRTLYGVLPAIKTEQPAFFATLDQKYAPNKVSWQVALDSLAHPDIPSHEQAVPNVLKFQERYGAFDQLRHKDSNLDLDAEIARLEQELTAIFQGR